MTELEQTVIPHIATNATRKTVFLLGGLLLLLISLSILSVGTGQLPIRPDQVITILADEASIKPNIKIDLGDVFQYPAEYTFIQRGTLLNIRLPRIVLGILIGSSLAAAGAVIQGMFRNPLADPGLIGISAGSAFATAAVIVLSALPAFKPTFDLLTQWNIPVRLIGSFLGGMTTTLLIYTLATSNGRTSVPTMLLTGIAVNALAGAGVGMLVAFGDDAEVRDITFWQLGSLVDSTWERVGSVSIWILLAMIPLLFLSRPLNALLFGETEAKHLGYDTQRIKQFIIVLVAISVGLGVAVAGVVGFVGLIVPHLIRIVAGPDHRYVLPGSMLLGGSLLVISDLIARTIAEGREIPLGVITALIGSPFFIYLLMKNRQKENVL
jgi:iron complex transport system permease protein